jgi:hypothetical protein
MDGVAGHAPLLQIADEQHDAPARRASAATGGMISVLF